MGRSELPATLEGARLLHDAERTAARHACPVRAVTAAIIRLDCDLRCRGLPVTFRSTSFQTSGRYDERSQPFGPSLSYSRRSRGQ